VALCSNVSILYFLVHQVPHRAALRLDVLDVICDTSNSNRLRDDYRFQISFEMGSTGENKTCGFCDLDIRMLDTSGGLEDAVYMGHASPVVDPVLPGTSIAQVLYAELEESETMPRYLPTWRILPTLKVYN